METSNTLVKIEDGKGLNLYRNALSGKKIMDMPKGEAIKAIVDALTRCYSDAGQIPDKQNLKDFAQSLYAEILIIFRACTIDELKLCLYNGIRREYGEFYGINLATIYQWIKAFIRSEGRQKAKLEYNRPVNEPAMTRDEAEQAWKESMQKQFLEYKQTGRLNIEFPTFQFREFENRGLMYMSKNEKESVFKQAVNKIVELKRIELVKVRTHNERVKVKGFIERVLAGVWNDTDKAEIQQEARRMAIQSYYDSIDELKF